MRNYAIWLVALFGLLNLLQAQTPQSFQYQAIVRNSLGAPIPNRSVRFQLMVQQGQSGPLVYQEQHAATTSAQGLVVLEVGRGTRINGSGFFSALNWANGPFFLNLHFDSTGSGSFISMGSVELLSVPYALYSGKSGIADSARVSGNGMPNGTVTGQMLYWNGSAWVTLAAGSEGRTLTWCGGVPVWRVGGACAPPYPTGTVHCVPTPTVVDDVVNPTTGRIWMDRNLGAERVATSSTDALAFGDLYQWGRRSDGHQCRNSGTTTTQSTSDTPGHANFIINSNDWRNPNNDALWQGVNGTNNPCPTGYRLPTIAEWDAERLTWPTQNVIGGFNSVLKFPANGARGYQGQFYTGYIAYWSSTTQGTSSRMIAISGNNVDVSNTYRRADGNGVRCIKN
jgi:hypothetical protein